MHSSVGIIVQAEKWDWIPDPGLWNVRFLDPNPYYSDLY